MDIDVLIEDDRWAEIDLVTVAEVAIVATCTHQNLAHETIELSVLACDNARIAVLNGDFRDKPTATNVLSWPATDLTASVAGDLPRKPKPSVDGTLALGDIALAYETCRRESRALSKPMQDHVTHLVVHGTLHLLGYDHLRDPDATLMERIEADILGKLGLDDPYM